MRLERHPPPATPVKRLTATTTGAAQYLLLSLLHPLSLFTLCLPLINMHKIAQKANDSAIQEHSWGTGLADNIDLWQEHGGRNMKMKTKWLVVFAALLPLSGMANMLNNSNNNNPNNPQSSNYNPSTQRLQQNMQNQQSQQKLKLQQDQQRQQQDLQRKIQEQRDSATQRTNNNGQLQQTQQN